MLGPNLILRAMRGEMAVEDVGAAAGADLAEFRQERDALLRGRLPPAELRLHGTVGSPVEIIRDGYGIPHIYAAATEDVFDIGPLGLSGSASTVRNTGLGAAPDLMADSGAEYRLIVDLADDSQIWATQNVGQSGQPGSPHYQDQLVDWARGDYHALRLRREDVVLEQTAVVTIEPSKG